MGVGEAVQDFQSKVGQVGIEQIQAIWQKRQKGS